MIPLNAVYASFDQENLEPCNDAVANADFGDTMNVVRNGPARIILCVGNDVAAAVKCSERAFFTPEEPMPSVIEGRNTRIWVAAYFGMDGSTPPAFQVRAVEITGHLIRVGFEQIDSSQRSCDLRTDIGLAPLNHLEAGTYALELFDTARRETVATRLWRVTRSIESADK